MALDIVVRVAFASDAFAASPTWTDISGDVMSLYIRRGRQHQLDRMEAGTATIQLKNTSGDYWPNNVAGLYYPNIKPVKRVNIRMVWDSTTYDLYTGFVENWPPGYLRRPSQGAIMTLQCADLIKNLSRLKLNSAGYAQEVSGTRIGNVLTTLAWPAADRALDTGQSTIIASGALANQIASEHLFLVQSSERGILFIAGDGKATFHDRYHRYLNNNTPRAIFGDLPNMPIADWEPVYEDQYIYNDVRLTRSGGSEQAVSDSDSDDDYGTRTYQVSGLLIPTDNEVLDQANFLLSRYKQPAMRAKSITIKSGADSDNLLPKILGYEISDRITLTMADAAIDEDYHIEGVNMSWNIKDPDEVVCKWQLSNAENQDYWILGTSALEAAGTRLCY